MDNAKCGMLVLAFIAIPLICEVVIRGISLLIDTLTDIILDYFAYRKEKREEERAERVMNNDICCIWYTFDMCGYSGRHKYSGRVDCHITYGVT